MTEHPCEHCAGTFSLEPVRWCCSEREASYEEFMAAVRVKRDEIFWSIVERA